MSLVATGLTASFLVGLAIGVGALPALFLKNVPDKLMIALLGGTAGVMLAATSFSLIIPGIEHGDLLWPGYGVYVVAAGAMLFVISDEIIPETHAKGRSRLATFGIMIGFVIMMTLDNLLG